MGSKALVDPEATQFPPSPRAKHLEIARHAERPSELVNPNDDGDEPQPSDLVTGNDVGGDDEEGSRATATTSTHADVASRPTTKSCDLQPGEATIISKNPRL
jgi:hypothetical protein